MAHIINKQRYEKNFNIRKKTSRSAQGNHNQTDNCPLPYWSRRRLQKEQDLTQ